MTKVLLGTPAPSKQQLLDGVGFFTEKRRFTGPVKQRVSVKRDGAKLMLISLDKCVSLASET